MCSVQRGYRRGVDERTLLLLLCAATILPRYHARVRASRSVAGDEGDRSSAPLPRVSNLLDSVLVYNYVVVSTTYYSEYYVSSRVGDMYMYTPSQYLASNAPNSDNYPVGTCSQRAIYRVLQLQQ